LRDLQYLDGPLASSRCQTQSRPGTISKLARDYDCLAFRADTRINQIIKEAAAATLTGASSLVDAVETRGHEFSSGIAGDEYLYEHVHFNFDGNFLLGRALGGEGAPLLPASIKARDKGAWASAHDWTTAWPWSLRDRYRVLQATSSRFSEPPSRTS